MSFGDYEVNNAKMEKRQRDSCYFSLVQFFKVYTKTLIYTIRNKSINWI